MIKTSCLRRKCLAAQLTVPLDQRTIGGDHLAQSGDQPSCHLPARLARAFF
jgi:hypothetical protein